MFNGFNVVELESSAQRRTGKCLSTHRCKIHQEALTCPRLSLSTVEFPPFLWHCHLIQQLQLMNRISEAGCNLIRSHYCHVWHKAHNTFHFCKGNMGGFFQPPSRMMCISFLMLWYEHFACFYTQLVMHTSINLTTLLTHKSIQQHKTSY